MQDVERLCGEVHPVLHIWSEQVVVWIGVPLQKQKTQQQQLHEQNGSQGTQFGFISTSNVESERLSFKVLVLVY